MKPVMQYTFSKTAGKETEESTHVKDIGNRKAKRKEAANSGRQPHINLYSESSSSSFSAE